MPFVHLHNRTHYSFLDGAMSPQELVAAAKNAGMKAVAMTDSANLCGLVEFYNASKEANIKPIFGCEIWIGEEASDVPSAKTNEAIQQLSLFGGLPRDPIRQTRSEPQKLTPKYHLVLLIEDEQGYRNLCALISTAHRQRHYAPLISIDQLSERSKGLLCLTSGEHGPIGLLERDDLQRALKRLDGIFGDRLFLEVHDWGLEHDEERNQKVRERARETGIKLVATNNSRYPDCFGSPMYNVLRSIAIGHNPFDGSSPFIHATDQAYVKTEEEMLQLFEPSVLETTEEICARCNFKPELGGTFLPNSSPPPEITNRADQWRWLIENFPAPGVFQGHECTVPPADPKGWDIVDSYFAWYTRTGLEVRLQEETANFEFATREEYFEGLEMELEVIQRMKFPAYHLIVAEFINWAKDRGISVGPGRGSAAGSIAVWAMRITDVNPRQFGLMFERFLNPKRISMPDIDVDFEQSRREEVISHVQAKYGDECVGQILTIGTMKAKAALKDCARACAVHFMDADRWSKEISDDPKAKLMASIADSPLLSKMFEHDPKFRNVASIAAQIEKRPRQTGVHAAGVIITNRAISHFVPTHYEQGGDKRWKSTTGMEMNAAEKMGLVKFDFLGLKTLDIIDVACASVERMTGVRPRPIQPLFDDPKVFELLAVGDTLGLFQLESDGMQNLCRRMQTNHMDDIVAISALYRPGPLEGGMVDQYVECKRGREKPQYPHELLEEVLKPTYGVFVFQEQVMKAAQVLAGFDLGDADLLRRAMGKKKQAEMDQQRRKFIDGCWNTNQIQEDKATYIFDLIDKFAGYGFNKTISEETWVLRAGRNESMSTPWIQIKDLVKAWNSRKDGYLTPIAKKLRSGKLNLIQMDEDGKCRPGRLKAIHDHGVKPVFRLRMKSGNLTPPMSENHRVLTEDGYKAIRTGLAVGDHVVFMGEHSSRAYSSWWISQESRFSQRLRCNQDYMATCEFVWDRDGSQCQICSSPGDRRRGGHEVAHIKTPAECRYDADIYHSPNNLQLLCNGCHKQLDYRKSQRTKRWQKGRPTFLDEVIAVEYVGEHHCYDLEMVTAGHNYVASSSPSLPGLISHNSHSAAYGIITYATAFMKAHHRAHLMAAAMSFESSNREKLVAYTDDCTRAGIKILLPDIHESGRNFEVTDLHGTSIRYGLEAIKGIGGSALESILEARQVRPFHSLYDIMERTTANKTVLQALICSGALDSLHPDRFEAWWSLEEPNLKGIWKKRQDPDQTTMDGVKSLEVRRGEQIQEQKPAPWTFIERLDREMAVLGIWLSGHPLDRFVDVESRSKTMVITALQQCRKGASVSLAGVITKIHTIKTKHGDRMTFFSISDRTGLTEVALPPSEWTRFKRYVWKGNCVQVQGMMDRDGIEGRVKIVDMKSLFELRIMAATALEMLLEEDELKDPKKMHHIRQMLESRRTAGMNGCRIEILTAHKNGIRMKTSIFNGDRIQVDLELFEEMEKITRRPHSLRIPGDGQTLEDPWFGEHPENLSAIDLDTVSVTS